MIHLAIWIASLLFLVAVGIGVLYGIGCLIGSSGYKYRGSEDYLKDIDEARKKWAEEFDKREKERRKNLDAATRRRTVRKERNDRENTTEG